MKRYAYSLSAIVDVACVDMARRILWAIGHDNVDLASFSARLSAKGLEPPTHYGLHTYVDRDFVDLVRAAQVGNIPAAPRPDSSWLNYGLSVDDVREVMTAMTVVIVDGGTVSDTWSEAKRIAGVQSIAGSPDDAAAQAGA